MSELNFYLVPEDEPGPRFYLNFCIVDTFELSPDILRDLEVLMGAPLRLIGERM